MKTSERVGVRVSHSVFLTLARRTDGPLFEGVMLPVSQEGLFRELLAVREQTGQLRNPVRDQIDERRHRVRR